MEYIVVGIILLIAFLDRVGIGGGNGGNGGNGEKTYVWKSLKELSQEEIQKDITAESQGFSLAAAVGKLYGVSTASLAIFAQAGIVGALTYNLAPVIIDAVISGLNNLFGYPNYTTYLVSADNLKACENVVRIPVDSKMALSRKILLRGAASDAEEQDIINFFTTYEKAESVADLNITLKFNDFKWFNMAGQEVLNRHSGHGGIPSGEYFIVAQVNIIKSASQPVDVPGSMHYVNASDIGVIGDKLEKAFQRFCIDFDLRRQAAGGSYGLNYIVGVPFYSISVVGAEGILDP